jgi:hypothetical protein
MPGRHPDDDVLADLAADVLPPVDARAVEAHVMSCDRCAALLEDAERVRGLLLADDPGPVPAQVWQRIEAALAAEAAPGRSHTTAGHDRSAPRSPAVGDPAADTAAFQAFVRAPDGGDHSPGAPLPPAPAEPAEGTAGWAEDADPLDDPARWTAPRAVRGGGAGRRRDARDDGARRRTPVLFAAAAAVVLIAAVGGVTRLTSGGDASTSAGVAAPQTGPSAVAGAEGLDDGAVVLRSKRAYREATLAQDAAALLTSFSTLSAAGGQGKATATTRATPRGLDAARAQMDASADDLTNPARLSACLDALNVSQDRLIAVDLATYEGREAAILLLRTSDGGREVWAVERTCAPGNEGALKYARLSG